jgi:hypothetical protein
MTLRLIFAIGVVGLAAGCFKPDIVNGGFTCADGGLCPDGFVCALVDNRCYKVDAGPEVAACVNPPPAPVDGCSDGPATGDACNPACQRGCSCGRCTVANDKAACVPAGMKHRGDVCDLASDDCQAGLGCIQEPATCGPNFGRCYQFCRTSADCPAGVGCAITLNSGHKVCGLAPQACDPKLDTGCPDNVLGCYWTEGNTTYCDCRGVQDEADVCGIYNNCITGFTCVQTPPNPLGACRMLCTPGGGECLAPQTCRTGGNPYGYCI